MFHHHIHLIQEIQEIQEIQVKLERKRKRIGDCLTKIVLIFFYFPTATTFFLKFIFRRIFKRRLICVRTENNSFLIEGEKKKMNSVKTPLREIRLRVAAPVVIFMFSVDRLK